MVKFRIPCAKHDRTALALLFLLLASMAAIAGAYISQYIFGLQPCILCLYQRNPYYAIIVLSLIAFFLIPKKYWQYRDEYQKMTLMICVMALVIGFVIALYHVGVEHRIFPAPNNCGGDGLNKIDDINALRDAIFESGALRCDKPAFTFLTLSMAAYNAIYSLLLITGTFLIIKKR